MHLMFYVSLLEFVNLEMSLQKIFYFQPDEGQMYFMKKIFNYRRGKYLMKWENYGNKENIWEPKKNLINC